MKKLEGIPVSSGSAAGPAFVYRKRRLEFDRRSIDDPDAEWARLNDALKEAQEQIQEIRQKAESETSEEQAAVFDAHIEFLHDPSLLDSVHRKIQKAGINVEAAWVGAIEGFATRLEDLEEGVFKERAADVRDVGDRVLRILLQEEDGALSALLKPSIIVAQDLTPSDTVTLDKELVLGFCTAGGGPTSHTAILARTLGIPAVVGVGESLLEIEQASEIALDGDEGQVILQPSEETIEEFKKKSQQEQALAKERLATAHEPAITEDGHRVEIAANVGRVEDAEAALEFGAEAIGLLRTEFLYLDRKTEPDEETQQKAYDAILQTMGDRPVVVRTLDVGGDKPLAYLHLVDESNPFLGWRAIRYCLDHPDLFKVQLRALLRAGHGHDLRIMFPMVATLAEVQQAKALLREAQAEVGGSERPSEAQLQVGIMVEIPSVALLAEQFANDVDFFSVGTNDLTQYTMAAERGNEKVAHLNDACHPAVLRQIKTVIEAGHDAGIWVGLCGELAGDPMAAPVLLGMGLDEFSMTPAAIPRIKEVIRRWTLEEAKDLAARALEQGSAEAVRELLQEFQKT